MGFEPTAPRLCRPHHSTTLAPVHISTRLPCKESNLVFLIQSQASCQVDDTGKRSGPGRTRTDYLLRARQALFQVSYKPIGAPGGDRTHDLRLTMAALYRQSSRCIRAPRRSRTADLALTRGALFQLSYRGLLWQYAVVKVRKWLGGTASPLAVVGSWEHTEFAFAFHP